MKQLSFKRVSLLVVAVTLVMVSSYAQKSPAATATGKVNGATITIKYSSPSVRGRKIWGDLVPYGEVWRAGANEATIVETDKDITVEGKPLKKGKYSLYAIAGEKEWSIILNSETGQWGTDHSGGTTRNPDKDVALVKVKPAKSVSMNEALVYVVSDKGFVLRWENLEVPVGLK